MRPGPSRHWKALVSAAARPLAGRVAVVAGATRGAGGENPKGLALSMAAELKPHGVAAVAITPGYLRSESMLQHFGVTEANWQEHGKKDRNFLVSETPLYVGRAVAALMADPGIMKKTGQLFSSWELAREFRFTDADGRRPDWGRSDIDYSRHPAWLVDLIRDGCEIQVEWLDTLSKRTKFFLKKIPKPSKAPAKKGKRP